MVAVTNWVCIHCEHVLGEVHGGELLIRVPDGHSRTRGANLVLTCPNCKAEKVWYTADPIVRALYQLTDAVATQAAKRMVEAVSQQTLKRP